MFDRLIDSQVSKFIISSSLGFFIVSCGIAIIKCSDLSLETANSKLTLLSQAKDAKNLVDNINSKDKTAIETTSKNLDKLIKTIE